MDVCLAVPHAVQLEEPGVPGPPHRRQAHLLSAGAPQPCVRALYPCCALVAQKAYCVKEISLAAAHPNTYEKFPSKGLTQGEVTVLQYLV